MISGYFKFGCLTTSVGTTTNTSGAKNAQVLKVGTGGIQLSVPLSSYTAVGLYWVEHLELNQLLIVEVDWFHSC